MEGHYPLVWQKAYPFEHHQHQILLLNQVDQGNYQDFYSFFDPVYREQCQ